MMKFKFYALKLVGIMFLIFIIQILVPGFNEMFVLNQSSYSEIWRFFTAIFLHGDITHFLLNGFALALFGSILESVIGGRRFLILFFFSGILANIFAINFYDSALGASGAIYGVLGALVILRPLMLVWAFGLPMPMILAGIIWAAIDIFGVLNPNPLDNTGHLAHLSGMAVGIIAAFFLRVSGNVKKKNGLF